MTHDRIERRIESGIRDYMSRDPEPGIEARVLRRAVRHRKLRRRCSWAVTAFAMAVCALFVFVPQRHEPVSPAVPAPAPRIVEREVEQFGRPRRSNPAARSGDVRLALVEFAAKHPREAERTAARLASPIVIEQIEIAPILVNALETEEEKNQ